MSKTGTKSSTPFGTAATSAGPTGTRPPTRPDTGLIVVRCVLLLAIVVMTVRPFVVEWAVAQPPLAVLREAALLSGRPVPATTRALSTVAAGVRGLYLPPGLWAIAGLIALGAVVLVVELLLNLVLLVLQTQRMARQPQSYLRIRTPQPGVGSRSAVAVDGDDLFHTLHRLLPHYGTHTGTAPWLTLLLHARPDEPVEFGVALSGGTTTQRASWMATIRKIVSGSEPNALVDSRPDPLLAALQPGSIVYWRELTALHPPAYPLRLSDAADGDLLSPIVAALRGRLGASYSEYQVIVRPRHDWDLTNGWRVYALRRLLKLRAHHQYFLNPDMQALQTKIDSPAYDVTLRVVSVARDRRQVAAAQSELAEITAILLGQYQARSGTRLQRLLVVGGGQVTVPQPLSRIWRRRVFYQLLTVAAAVSAAAATNLLLKWLIPNLGGVPYFT